MARSTSARYDHTEGAVARTIEEQTAKLPSDTFLWVSAAGYDAATQRVSASSDPIVFRLRRNGTDVKTESEPIARGCRCGSDLFTHAAR